MRNLKCKEQGCDKPVKARGWCFMHYMRWWRHGDPSIAAAASGSVGAYLRDVVVPYEDGDCLIWPFHRIQNGYAQVRWGDCAVYAHRLVCELVNGPPPTPEHEAAHSCGKGHLGCVNPRHLSWKTHVENEADKIVHGTHTRGERNGGAKLTEADIREIKSLEGTMSQREIAKRFGVWQTNISHILRGRSWAWLK